MQPKNLAFIDTLRGFASLYVLVFHLAFVTTPSAAPPAWLAPIIGAGGAGVMLFFIVSAFTLCLSMDSRATGTAEPVSHFYIRRFFRIAPLFYLWLAIYFVRDILYFHITHGPAEIAANGLFVFNLIPGQQDGYVAASWTIGVEAVFYAIFPLLFFYARNVGVGLALLLIAMVIRLPFHAFCLHEVADPSIAEAFYERGIIFNLAVFMAGVVAYHIYKNLDVGGTVRFGIGHALIAGFAAGLIYQCYVAPSPDRTQNVAFQTLFFSFLLLGLGISPIKIFVNKITQFFGKISYSVYLCHVTTLFFMSPVFAYVYRQTEYKTLAFGMSVVLALAVITPLSYLTYRYVEIPGTQLGRTLIRRRLVPTKAMPHGI